VQGSSPDLTAGRRRTPAERAAEVPADAAVDAFLRASRALVAVAARSLADVEQVTLPQYRALVVLSRPSPCTPSDLAEALGVHPSTVTRLCDRLVGKGLVRRVAGVADRRETTVALTAAGRRLIARVTDIRRRDIEAVVARMKPADARRAVAVLAAFADAAGEPPTLDLFGWTGDDHDAPAPARRSR
jgi:DNA-binding MarR family transcriptional regulator